MLAITWVTMAVHGLLLYGEGPFWPSLTAVYSVAALRVPAARLGLAAVLLVRPVALLDRDTPYSSWATWRSAS